MIQVTELGYMGIGVKAPDAWRKFASEVVGFEVADDGERDRFYLRMDYWHHRVVVHHDNSDDLLYLGFRVAGGEEFAQMQHQLKEAGIAFRVGSGEEAEERRVLEVMKLADPDGNPIEIFHGPELQLSKPLHPGRGMHGRFKTGIGGMGHCFISQRDSKAGYRFYTALGMRGATEYKIKIGDHVIMPTFMHCNDRDHTIAFGIPGTNRRINHLMVEVENFDDVGLTHEIVRRQKIPVAMGLGKHSNDHMYSFYFRNPSGWNFEYGWNGRPASYQSEYYREDAYGHHPESGGFELPEK